MKLAKVLATILLAIVMALATAPFARADADLYVTPGDHTVNGRQWRTTCEPYSVTERCRTEIWGSVVERRGGTYVVANGWMFNNLTYVASPYSVWMQNSLAQSFDRLTMSGSDRTWRSECFTALTGRGCRGWVEATVIETQRTATGSNVYRKVDKWVLNHMIRFDSTPIPPHFANGNALHCEAVAGGRNILIDVVDPDNLGYGLLLLTGAEKVVIDTVPGTRTVKYFQPNRTCDEYWGAVALS